MPDCTTTEDSDKFYNLFFTHQLLKQQLQVDFIEKILRQAAVELISSNFNDLRFKAVWPPESVDLNFNIDE